MRSYFRRYLIFAIVALAVLAIPLHSARSQNETGSLDQQINGVLGVVDQCKTVGLGGLKSTFDKLSTGYIKQFVSDTIKDIADSLIAYAANYVTCKVAGLLGFGTGSTGGPTCTWDMGGALVANAKRLALDKIRQDLTAACILDATGNAMALAIETRGPDGGPAYVTDYATMDYVESQRGTDRFYAELVNTKICPYFKDQVYSYFGVPQSYIDNPPSIMGIVPADGVTSFPQLASCTMPDGFDPSTSAFDPGAILAGIQPQNNFDGFIQMGEAELSAQQQEMMQAAKSDAAAGRGYRSFVSCINQDPNGKCLAWDITQQSGSVADTVLAERQAELNNIQNNATANDVRRRILGELLQFGAQQADTLLSDAAQHLEDIANGVATPDALPGTPVPSVSPADDLCTGGNPDCVCVMNDPKYLTLTGKVAQAEDAAIAFDQGKGIVSDDGTHVLPGQNQAFLQSVSASTIGESMNMHPNGDYEVVVDGGPAITVSISVITSGNAIRKPGRAIAACLPGVQ